MDVARASTILRPLERVSRSNCGEVGFGRRAGLGQLAAIDPRGRRPGARRRAAPRGCSRRRTSQRFAVAPDLRRGGARDPLEPGLVVVRAAGIDLALGQHVRLAAERRRSARSRARSRPGTRSWPAAARRASGPAARNRASSSFTARSTLARSPPGLRRGLDHEEPADLAQVHVGGDVGRDLLVVHQPLVQPGRLAGRQQVADQLELLGVGGAPARHVPHLVDPRLRHPVVHDARAGCRSAWRPTAPAGRSAAPRGCRRNTSRPCAFTSSGSTSPATTITALAAP